MYTNPILSTADNFLQAQIPYVIISPLSLWVISVLWALLFLSSALITGSISKSRKQFNVVSEFFPVRWKKRHSISWHSIESDSSPWWWALPFLYVTSSGVLRVALSRLVILPRRIIPQFQSPEQMNLIPDQNIQLISTFLPERQVTSRRSVDSSKSFHVLSIGQS